MTLMTATSLNDQVDYISTNGQSFADETLNSIFNVSPRSAIIEEDDDDDLDATLPDPDDDDDDLMVDDDDDLMDDDDDDTEIVDADELDAIDDTDDGGIVKNDLAKDDEHGSVTSGFNNSTSFADRPLGRTSGRMTDHEPGN